MTEKPFYLSQKFWFAVAGIAAITVLAALGKLDISGLDISVIVAALIGGRAIEGAKAQK